MNKKSALSFVLICLAGLPLTAQPGNDAKDPKAKAILDELTEKNRSYTSISAEFSYTLENKDEGINQSEKGKLLLKGKKYKLEIAGQEIISNGKTVWTYLKDADEVQIDNVSTQDNNQINPTNIFTIYEKGFKYQFVKDETINGKQLQLIKLFPDNPADKSYHTIKLYVDKARKQMESIQVLSKDGNNYTYILTSFNPNVTVADGVFEFDVSKVDEVIDLRE